MNSASAATSRFSPGEHVHQAGNDHFAHARTDLHRGAGAMGLQHRLLELEQFGGYLRLIGEHIQRRTGNLAALQGSDQIGLVDQLAAGDIDQVTRLFVVDQPRPTKGILVAITVMFSTLAESGSAAM